MQSYNKKFYETNKIIFFNNILHIYINKSNKYDWKTTKGYIIHDWSATD